MVRLNTGSKKNVPIAVVGGGAAGYFAAIRCAEAAPAAAVTIFEAGRRPLDKVRISGGGRCNVTHACFDPARLIGFYPRGARALRGPFTRFGPRECIDWFEQRGVPLKTEDDGRVFPESNSSGSIIDCLRKAAEAAGVRLETGRSLRKVAATDFGFRLEFAGGDRRDCERLLLCTGGAPGGQRLAASLGHRIVDPVPSLFTFNIAEGALHDLSGVALANAELKLPGTKLSSTGPLLVTHVGLSGPAVLRLSSLGAREFAACDYRMELRVNWRADANEEELRTRIKELRHSDGARRLQTSADRFGLPRRLWRYLLDRANLADDLVWSRLSSPDTHALVEQLSRAPYRISGKATFKEEFVICGGVALGEVDFRTMQSRLIPGLYLAGELLDVDALTGGFNFQNAWTTGYIAGESMAAASTDA